MSSTVPEPSGRARRMAPQERRAMILDAAIPLLREHGGEVTTRQIADAACIAEGTIFRVFADKDAIVDAAIDRVMDPAQVLEDLSRIDRAASLDVKVEQIVTRLHTHVSSVVAFMGALGPRDHARHRGGNRDHHGPPLGETAGAVEALLIPHAAQLRIPVGDTVDYLRVLVLGTAMPFLRGDTETDPAALADVIMRGVAAETE